MQEGVVSPAGANHFQPLYEALKKHGSPPWGGVEANVGIPGALIDWESYLAWHYNHGAALVALMEALVAGGDYAAAILVYRELRLLLLRELHIEPAPETTARFRYFQAAARRRALPRSSALPLRADSAERPPSHLPHPITDVIGRELVTATPVPLASIVTE